MAGRIPQAFIDELIARADIVEIIGSRVPLKKAGREYKACCPFHDEKTASFWVSPDKQFYHCFGCGAHGTALGFLMEYDRLPFPEAVEDLAGRLGLRCRTKGGAPARRRPAARRQMTLHRSTSCWRSVADFYRCEPATQRARPGLRRAARPRRRDHRALPHRLRARLPGTRCCAASAPASATSARCSPTGLIIERERAQHAASEPLLRPLPRPDHVPDPGYARPGDRLRRPRARRGEPKYLNSPETALFHKGQELYGLYETRQARAPASSACWWSRATWTWCACIRRASPTRWRRSARRPRPNTCDRAFRLVSEVVFCFDGDRAGRAAAWRALQQALPEAREGRELRFLFLPEGEDPDSLVGREGGERFEARLARRCRCRNTWWRNCASRPTSATRTARRTSSRWRARCWRRSPPGVYRELLLDRVAAAHRRCRPSGCSSGWQPTGRAPGQRTLRAQRAPARRARGASRTRHGRSAAAAW